MNKYPRQQWVSKCFTPAVDMGERLAAVIARWSLWVRVALRLVPEDERERRWTGAKGCYHPIEEDRVHVRARAVWLHAGPGLRARGQGFFWRPVPHRCATCSRHDYADGNLRPEFEKEVARREPARCTELVAASVATWSPRHGRSWEVQLRGRWVCVRRTHDADIGEVGGAGCELGGGIERVWKDDGVDV
jgi:hypothetical protein